MTTQLQTLRAFPNTIQWLKEWDSTTQYVKNDTVISPTDMSLYILTVTSELGGDDPATNTNWFPVTAPSFIGVSDIRTDGAYINNTGTATNVILTSYGAHKLVPGANISITGTTSNPIINAVLPNPRFCLLFLQSSATNVGFPATSVSLGIITYGTSVSTFFNDCIANGAPDPNGAFYLDLTSINLVKSGNGIGVANRLFIAVRDTTLNTQSLITIQFNSPIDRGAGNRSLGIVNINVARIRADGVRAINAFEFRCTQISYQLVTAGDIKAVYSPTG